MLLCSSLCDVTLFDIFRHYYVHVYVHHIATLVCLVDCNVTIFDTLQGLEMFVTLRRRYMCVTLQCEEMFVTL
jgi:hypothetical protein